MQLGPERAKVPLPAVDPGKSHAGGPGKVDFNCSNSYRRANRLFIFYVKFSAAWRNFV